MDKNTSAMVEYNHKRGLETRERVISAIKQCEKEGFISTTLVCKIAGVSRTYFTNHSDVRKLLDDAMNNTNRRLKKKRQSEDDKDTLNRALYIENARLKKEIADLKKDIVYKEKYQSALEEIEKLKREAEQATKQNLLKF